jgi:hypothetical protein
MGDRVCMSCCNEISKAVLVLSLSKLVHVLLCIA